MFTFVLLLINLVLNARIVLTPSVVCFILWRIQTPNRPLTLIVLFDSEKICGTGEVYLTVSSHKTRTSVRIKLNFSFCAFKIMWNCKWFCCRYRSGDGCMGRGDGRLALSFVVVSHFASLRSIKRHFLFVCKNLLV